MTSFGDRCPGPAAPTSRRAFLRNAGAGFGAIALAALLADEGKLVAGIYGEDPRLLDEKRQAEIVAHPPAQKYPRLESVYAEWIAACKGGTPAGSNFPDHAGPLTEMVLLGNLALRTAQVLEIDSRSGEVANTNVPAEYVRSEYRAGWTV